LYYCALKSPPTSHKISLRNRKNEKVPVRCFCIDSELVYWNFFLDFGPLNLGQLYRFTVQLNQLLQDSSSTVLFYSSTNSAKRANAIYLICAWQVLELHRSPEQAFYGFSYYSSSSSSSSSEHDEEMTLSSKSYSTPPPYPLTSVGQATVGPLPAFHDASPCACTYEITILHCLHGLKKAKQFKFFDWDTFNVEEYEYYEQVEVRHETETKKGEIANYPGKITYNLD
jgi:cell division cycle 14